MKKLSLILYVVIMFFVITWCPFSVDSAHGTITSNLATKAIEDVHTEGVDGGWPVPEPISLVLLGSGLVTLSLIGRKKFGK